MAWSEKSEYECPECAGEGEVECDCCGATNDCEYCNGCRLDPQKIDVAAYEKACRNMKHEGGAWDWIEDGHWIGRETACDRIAIGEFLKSATT
jgi:hypothetical protein